MMVACNPNGRLYTEQCHSCLEANHCFPPDEEMPPRKRYLEQMNLMVLYRFEPTLFQQILLASRLEQVQFDPEQEGKSVMIRIVSFSSLFMVQALINENDLSGFSADFGLRGGNYFMYALVRIRLT
mmetsp:Transcript_2564/g.3593  ORF Transcript_2564/g.3593 Transcript_2564/m.3593 type:complete len:126 (-) Transcript_2564:32-409(-)